MKRVIIVHGWYGYPHEGWFPWLKKVLEDKGYSVEVPEMPDTDHPKIDEWVNKDGVVTEREARSGTHVVMNPRKPIGKLWLPARLHHPIALYEQRENLEWFMEDNSRWKPLIRELIDLNGDGRHSHYEIRDAMYRMFPH